MMWQHQAALVLGKLTRVTSGGTPPAIGKSLCLGFQMEKARQGQPWALTITSTTVGMYLVSYVGASHMGTCAHSKF